MRAKDIHKKRFAGNYPFGTDGDLLITNGQTVNITSNKDYSSVQIDAGGTLNVNSISGAWVSIGCKNNFVLNGTINSRANATAGGTFTATNPRNLSLSYTITQRNGGNGGRGGTPSGHLGGAQSAGFGGGGGSLNTVGGAAGGGLGGNGANGSDQFGTVFGGSGWIDLADPNTAGANANSDGCCNPCLPDAVGAGGGGSSRGAHGGGLDLTIAGNASGNGTINLSGVAGSTGSKGGDAEAITNLCSGGPSAFGGGGGGGGAGGSGGKLSERIHGTDTSTWTVSVAGGAAGTPGLGGVAVATSSFNLNGASGGVSQAGLAGSTDIATY